MTIDRRLDTDRIDCMGGVLLLFEGHRRPDRESMRKIVDKLARVTISLDPCEPRISGRADGPADHQEMVWLELLSDGLTFDLVGLAPGRPIDIPEMRYRADLPGDFNESRYTALCVKPGPHLSGGINSLPVVRVMMGLVAAIGAALPPLRAILWPPAAAGLGPDLFRAHAESWSNGGPLPAHLLTSFRQMADGGLQSEGLAFFTGQEIRIEPDSVGDFACAVQLAARLVQQLAAFGPLRQTEEFLAPDGNQMRLVPSGNGKFVRVWRS